MEVNKMVGCSVMHMYNFLGSDGGGDDDDDVCAHMVHSCRLRKSVRKLKSVMQFSLFI
jgi:hypothetical protein